MVNVNDLSLIETYSDDNIDLSNVALYGDYSVLGSKGTPQNQINQMAITIQKNF